MLQYRPDEPQVKRNAISSIANLAYDLPHELPNDLRLRILRNKKILGKCQIWVETCPNALSLSRNYTLARTVKNTQNYI